MKPDHETTSPYLNLLLLSLSAISLFALAMGLFTGNDALADRAVIGLVGSCMLTAGVALHRYTYHGYL